MHTNNTHNNWSAGQLSNIIDSIRDSNNGKCSIRMVAERIGRGEWETWQILRDSGLPTRLYEESLELLKEEIERDARLLTMRELYHKYGDGWKNENSFYCYLIKNGIAWKRTAGLDLQNDFKHRGYDFTQLTLREIAEMYSLCYPTVVAIVNRHNIPHKKAPRGRQPKASA